MYSMFSYCPKLKNLDVSHFNTEKLKDTRHMFQSTALIDLNLSKWNTSGVIYMGVMFTSCIHLESLNLSGWNTSSVTDMSQMFNNCQALSKLVLCSFDTSKVSYMGYMFQNTSKLTRIYVGDKWTMDAVTDSTDMFKGSASTSVIQSI